MDDTVTLADLRRRLRPKRRGTRRIQAMLNRCDKLMAKIKAERAKQVAAQPLGGVREGVE